MSALGLVLAAALTSNLASSNSCGPSKAVSASYIAKITGKSPKKAQAFMSHIVRPQDGPAEIHVFAKIRGKWRAYEALQADQEIVQPRTAVTSSGGGIHRVIRGKALTGCFIGPAMP